MESIALSDGLLDDIRIKIERRQYEFSKHAVDQSILRKVTVTELEEAMTGSLELIEDYPEDKYGPSCLILGNTNLGRRLHVQCSYPARPLLKIITVYEPDPELWIEFRVRKTE